MKVAGYRVIGQRIPRLDGAAKVTGQAIYVGDMNRPRMLYGGILRSLHAHARIVQIDSAAARQVAGVKAVLTGADTLGIKYGILHNPARHMDKFALATQYVRHIGDEVAVVAADSPDAVAEALSKLQVEYEPLPAVFDVQQAMAEGAPLVHDHARQNICNRVFFDFGDVDNAFREADLVREDTYETQVVIHAPMEPHASLAEFGADGQLTVWAATQTPYYVRTQLAQTLGLPLHRVRVIKPYVGGGFGGKSDGMAPIDFCAALLAIQTGRPVQMVLDREEEFIGTTRRHPMSITVRTGITRDGTVTARSLKLLLDGGAYASWGPITNYLCAIHLHMPYRLPNSRYEGFRIYTHKPPCGAQRGHGAPQVHWAVETQLDQLATDLGIDPVDLRIINGLQTGETTAMGMHISSSGFAECVRRVAAASDWTTKRQQRDAGRYRQGIGIGCSAFMSGAGASPLGKIDYAHSAAEVRLELDGRVVLSCGAADVGQGSDTVLVQIVAEVLGLQVEDVVLTPVDTQVTPIELGSYSSRTTVMAGNAVLQAAQAVKDQLLATLAGVLGTGKDALELVPGGVQVTGDEVQLMGLAEVIARIGKVNRGNPLVGRGTFNPIKGSINPSYSFGVQVAEVEVDIQTGQVRVLKMSTAHDCGTALNPLLVEGQVEGSIHMGLGSALWEEVVMEAGQVMQPSFLGYSIPTPPDLPEIQHVTVEGNDPVGPFGAKEAGEGLVGPTAPAVLNAIYNATGVRLMSLPARREDILKGLAAAGK